MGYILELRQHGHSKVMFVQQHQASCVVTRDTSRISFRLARAIFMLLKLRRETEVPFLVATVILEFLSFSRRARGCHLL